METDIVLEGFLEAEQVHGAGYMRFISDGDSSVYPTLLRMFLNEAKAQVCQPSMQML